MSFVSVIATKEYISVMTDGQTQTYDGEIVQEDYVKYRMINDKRIVAATGDVEVTEQFFGESLAMHNYGFNLKQMAMKLQELMIEYVEYDEDDPMSGWNINMIVGGIAEDGELELYVLSNAYKSVEEMQMREFRNFRDDDYVEAYLLSPYAPSLDKLTKTLFSAVQKNGATLFVNNGEKIVSSQEELHNYVASIDRSVNDNTFSKVINKRANQ
ncbi:hypothetical protein MN033_12970 [Bacillus nitratireducens]|uniref:hypothetical protein n=1 Tax=Bacillus nitratireducens TaxID=2026193 RepID=UPI001F57E473|nr:hypothetical protein [Bacillus nitratireducens]UNP78981.1 hypothetical protein MN033_12970 [Bacillus nitratireducens]